MGASPNRIVHDHRTGDLRWLELVYGSGDDGVHAGFVIGVRPPSESAPFRAIGRATLQIVASLYAAACDAEETGQTAALDAVFATLTTPGPSDSPWPGVVPATVWAAQTTAEKLLWAAQIVSAGLDARISA